jgi:site-specific DNA recombinase
MKTRRCAIYTRKSTEEGLEQAFNSLDAQREACGAYILSQAHEGWEALPDLYDDGGWSGGTMDRPALKQLLEDVASGKVDIIVVYKVDRLTRSLADFARIVDILDHAGASFVSVTQAFNTTNSMGRLTLNVLLSFAQFEREVTSERIRDKIAASKRKGMWMGGVVPLGYRVENRRLVIEESEAETVRMLFQRYVGTKSITRMVDGLAAEGIRTKLRTLVTGRTTGGVPFTRGSLSQLLQNPLYMGKVRHRRELFDGEHDAIIAEDQWNEVQLTLSGNRNDRRNGRLTNNPSLLTGMLADPDGRPMTPVFTTRGSKRHHYYVTRQRPGDDPSKAWRVPAGEVDRAVLRIVGQQLRDARDAGDDIHAIKVWQAMAQRLPDLALPEQRMMLRELGVKARIGNDHVEVTLAGGDGASVTSIPARHAVRGHEKKLILDDHTSSGSPDPVLVRMIALAKATRDCDVQGKHNPLVDRYSRRHRWQLLRISFLAPDIVSAIMGGTHPPTLTGRTLIRAVDLPFDWAGQRRLLGFKAH